MSKISINVWVPGIPKAQPRPRAFVRGGHARVYDAGTAEGWKSQIAEVVRVYLPADPCEQPIRVSLQFFMPRPKSHYRSSGQLKPTAPTYHTQKPDADNLAKAVMDCLSQLNAWRDDSRVCVLRVEKVWANQAPGCQITVSEV